jgi:hypothetical protein
VRGLIAGAAHGTVKLAPRWPAASQGHRPKRGSAPADSIAVGVGTNLTNSVGLVVLCPSQGSHQTDRLKEESTRPEKNRGISKSRRGFKDRKMDKLQIVRRLHEMADFCLFGPGIWPPDQTFLKFFNATVTHVGLEVDVPGRPGHTRCSTLGRELKLDLFMAFTGVYSPLDVAVHLKMEGYLDDSETEAIFAFTGSDAETARLIYRYTLRAYLKFCNFSHRMN